MISTTSSPIRILFFGTPKFASDILLGLHQFSFFRIVGVITGTSKIRGRHSLAPTDVCKTAKQLGLSVFECDSPKSEALLEFVQSVPSDIGVIVAWKILPEPIYRQPKYGTINLHASLLPQYRGAAPIQRAIWNGEKETGLTVFLLNAGIDTGQILLQKKLPLYDTDTTGDVLERFAPIGISLLKDAILGICNQTLTPIPQSDTLATLAPKIRPEERWIRWEQSAEEIKRQIHALSPEPCAITEVENQRILFYRATTSPISTDHPYGTILVEKREVKFVTGKGTLIAQSLCLEGKKIMTGAEFYNGYQRFHLQRCRVFV